MTVGLSVKQKNLPPPSIEWDDRTALLSAGPAQQLCAVGFEYLPAHLALEELPVAPGLNQASTDQLFDMERDGCLGHGELLPQLLAGAFLLACNGLQQRHASGVGQRLGDELELLVGQLRPRGRGLCHSSMVIELSYFVKTPAFAAGCAWMRIEADEYVGLNVLALP